MQFYGLYNMKKFLFVLGFLPALAFAGESNNFSTSIEYTSSELEFDVGLESRFNGFAIGFGSNPRNEYGYWGKVEYAENSKYDSSYYDATIGGHINLFTDDKIYLNTTVGVGYTRVDSGVTSSDLSFLTIPVGIEGGYAINKNIDLFAGLGYKWLFDRTGSAGYFGGGSSSASSTNTDPNKYPDKTLCNDGSWFDGTDSSACKDFGGIVSSEQDKTLCNNGTWSASTGSGTCSWNDGVHSGTNVSLAGARAKYSNSVSLGDADALSFKVGLRFNF